MVCKLLNKRNSTHQTQSSVKESLHRSTIDLKSKHYDELQFLLKNKNSPCHSLQINLSYPEELSKKVLSSRNQIIYVLVLRFKGNVIHRILILKRSKQTESYQYIYGTGKSLLLYSWHIKNKWQCPIRRTTLPNWTLWDGFLLQAVGLEACSILRTKE